MLAHEKFANAESAESDELLCSAYGSLANLSCITGHFIDATTHGKNAVRYFDRKRHQDSHWYAPHNAGVRCFTHFSLPLWHVGRVREAEQRQEEALVQAKATGHPNTIGYALFWCGLYANLIKRDFKSLITSAEKIVELTSEYSMPHWAAFALSYLAYDQFVNESPQAALKGLENGRELLLKTGNTWHAPVFASIAGEVLIQQGQFLEATSVLDEGLSEAKRTGEVWFNAELTRLKGEAELLEHPNDHETACETYASAAQIARDQGSKMFELRSAVSLANATKDLIRRSDAAKRITALLSEIDADNNAWDIQHASACLQATTNGD